MLTFLLVNTLILCHCVIAGKYFDFKCGNFDTNHKVICKASTPYVSDGEPF